MSLETEHRIFLSINFSKDEKSEKKFLVKNFPEKKMKENSSKNIFKEIFFLIFEGKTFATNFSSQFTEKSDKVE